MVFVSMWRVVANIFNKQSRTAHKRWTSNLGWALGCKLTVKTSDEMSLGRKGDMDWIYLAQDSDHWMNMVMNLRVP
jgi:hypothetical protein